MERHEKKIGQEASRILLLLNSLLRWILYCISQTSLKRVIDWERRSDVFCITKCDRHLLLNFAYNSIIWNPTVCSKHSC
jgi:hypothetical protein